LQSETNPESGTITYAYKPNDLVETVSDQRGIVRTYGYNTRNLAANVSYNDGGVTPSVTFGYDEFGSRTSMADGEGTTTYVYNGFRQLQSESRGLPNSRTSKLTYTWNLADQAKQVNYAIYNGATATFNKNVNYGRNNTGAISGIGTNLIGSDPNATTNVASSIGYRAWNVYRAMNFGNGLRLTAGYGSQRQQMTSFVVNTQSGSSVLWRQHYDYYESGKNNGRIRRLSDQADFSTYNKYHLRYLQPVDAGADASEPGVARGLQPRRMGQHPHDQLSGERRRDAQLPNQLNGRADQPPEHRGGVQLQL
jgi:hypothetical protein